MLILRAADRVATPWKNGLGLTREIATCPRGATVDGFDWRISMATVHQEGPFSHFPDVDRRLAVLEGRLALAIADRPTIEIEPGRPPVEFPGEASVEARLPAGPAIDLNVMTRRDRFVASLERFEVDEAFDVEGAETTVLLTETSGLGLAYAGRVHHLSALDAVMFSGATPNTLRLAPSSRTIIHVIRLTRQKESRRSPT